MHTILISLFLILGIFPKQHRKSCHHVVGHDKPYLIFFGTFPRSYTKRRFHPVYHHKPYPINQLY